MRRVARVLFIVGLAVGLTVGAGVPEAAAGGIPVVVSFAGTVNPPQAGITLPFGVASTNALNGSFTYNAAQVGSGGLFTFTGQSAVQFFFTITPSNFSDTYSSTFTTNNAFTMTLTNSGRTLDVHVGLSAVNVTNPGTPPVTAKADPFIDLIFTGKNAATALPTSQAAFTAEYTAKAATLNWDPPPISGQGGPTYGIGATLNMINGESIVPEPSSLILMGVAVAIGGIGLAISRRRTSRAA